MSESGPSPNGYDWEQERGRPDHLEAVEKMGEGSIGEVHPSAVTLARRLAINPDILQVFGRRYPDGRLELCGYSLLYPLKDETGTTIAGGRIRSGKELGPETLLPDFTDAKYLYIEMLLGIPDAAARSHAKACLYHELARWISGGKVRFVFARPASPSGLRLLHNYGFAPIAEEKDIWSVSTERLMRKIGLTVSDTS